MYHLNERNIVCEVCGFKTVNKPKMTRHMKSHTGERNYEVNDLGDLNFSHDFNIFNLFQCSICGKRFLYSYNVTAHIKHVHYHEKRPTTNEEKLTCTVCGKVKLHQNHRIQINFVVFHFIRDFKRFGRFASIWRKFIRSSKQLRMVWSSRRSSCSEIIGKWLKSIQ